MSLIDQERAGATLEAAPSPATVTTSSAVCVRVDGVFKKYCRSLKKSVLYGLRDVASAVLGRKSHGDTLRSGEFWALSDVNFEVTRGECVGVVGHNGAGKSTLLKLLNGVISPDQGHIEIAGRVGALIEVGAGFHPLLSGYENIYVNGAILGMSRAEIDRKLPAIVEFAGISEEALAAPVKTYSSGMYVRLGFAVAVHTDPDILLVDEVLAVGDSTFRARCYKALSGMLEAGASILLVSHDLTAIQFLCDRCIWMDDGRIKAVADTATIVADYLQYTHEKLLQEGATTLEQAPRKRISGAELLGVDFFDARGEPATELITMEPMQARIRYRVTQPIPVLHFSFTFRAADGDAYSGCYSFWDDFKLTPDGIGDGSIVLYFPTVLLGSGLYVVNVSLWDETGCGAYDWHWGVTVFRVRSHIPMLGRFVLPHHWSRELQINPAPPSS